MEYTRVLKYKMSGEDVFYIKKCLFSLKYYSTTVKAIKKKTFGSDTLKAVLAFQKANKDIYGEQLVADGKIGKLTWDAIVREYEKLTREYEEPTREYEEPTAVSLLKSYTHISEEKRKLIERDLAGVSETRKKIVLEILQWCHDHTVGGEPRSLYIIGANLYNIEKQIFYPTVSYIEKRASSRPDYFNGGRKEFMIAQIQKNPKLPASDCSGMEVGYMRKFGIKTFDATANSLCSDSHSTKIDKSALKPGDWVGKDGHIGTYVGGGYVVEFYGGAFTCALTALNSRTAYNFITKRLSTGSAWTKFRRPSYY